jgi:hypothetical protein
MENDDPKLHALIGQVDRLSILVEKVITQEVAHKQVVIHKTEGMGAIGIVCASISFCCLLAIGGMAWTVSIELNKQTADLHDLRAWKDIHAQHISALEAKEHK